MKFVLNSPPRSGSVIAPFAEIADAKTVRLCDVVRQQVAGAVEDVVRSAADGIVVALDPADRAFIGRAAGVLRELQRSRRYHVPIEEDIVVGRRDDV